MRRRESARRWHTWNTCLFLVSAPLIALTAVAPGCAPGASSLRVRAMPAWDSASRHLVALADDPGTRRWYTAHLRRQGDRFTLRAVFPLSGPATAVRWIPGQRRVLFHLRGRSGHIMALNLQSGGAVPLAHGYYPEISPDGRTLALYRRGGGLWLCDLASRRAQLVREATVGGYCLRPGWYWSPDSQALAFARMRGLDKWFATATLQSGGPPSVRNLVYNSRLVSNQGYYDSFGVGWKDGRTILFGRFGRLTRDKKDAFAIYSVSTSGGRVREQLPPGKAPCPIGEAMWLPGGRYVVYPTRRDGREFVRVDLRSGSYRRLDVGRTTEVSTYSASPDATLLVVAERRPRTGLIVGHWASGKSWRMRLLRDTRARRGVLAQSER